MTQFTGYTTGSGNALCALDKPVTYIPLPDTTHKNPCQQVQRQADFIGMLLFQQRQASLTASFDSLYRAKCLGAQSTEVFYAKYTPSEYHYTLYYYDQAGNLLKTLAPAAVQPNYSPAYLANVQTQRANNSDLTNGTNIENMAAQYRYNTLNQATAQKTPDAGSSNFWYDRLGRLAVSQNARQVLSPASYSYTLYDALGRITEVGQKPQTTLMTQTISQDTTALKNWLGDLSAGGTKVQIIRTVYDVAYPSFTGPAPIYQLNLRNRVAYTEAVDVDNTNMPPYRTASFYSYDVHGNVDTLLQDYGTASVMGTANNRFKLLRYDYDLISGKVNQVSYQPGMADAFYHQYTYDAENRLTRVRTSRDSLNWEYDGNFYAYYRHGPLAQVQLGDQLIQGINYAYTLQGWLKSINPSWVSTSAPQDLYDSDGTTASPVFCRDAYKLNLNYFDDGTYTDYKPIAPPGAYVQGNALPSAQKTNLYNGNIGSQAVDIRKLASGSASYAGPMIYNYRYDQLNRLGSMDAWAATGSFAPTGTTPLSDYSERYGYDPNGNILTLTRHGTTGTGLAIGMDSLAYQYLYVKSSGGGLGEYVPGQAPTTGVDHLTNQLASIRDAVTSSGYSDIKNQSALNYQYDAIGNLVGDAQSQITNISWSVYGKILSITDSGKTITYTYDAAGNRISKTANGITTWYVRDAAGNVMSVYTIGDNSRNAGAVTQSEVDMYGSSRLGILNLNVNCTSLSPPFPLHNILVRGSKLFELTNHLGNVLVTISDKKLQHTPDSVSVDYFLPDVISATDYYSFGMPMPGRSFNNANYRYGFNGKENDNEVKGTGNEIDYGMRIYDPRVGRFMSVDPLTKQFPWYTPYLFAGNKPVAAADLDGMEEWMKTQENLLRQITIEKIDHLKVQALNRQTFISSMPSRDQYQEQQLREYRIQRYQELGYNDDGSKPPLMRLAENKTFTNFASNIALPILEGYSYLDGAAEMRGLYKGTNEAISFLGKKEFEVLGKTGTVDAKAIRFSQNSISAKFSDGTDIQALIDKLKSGQKIDIEPIRIVYKDDMVFTLDNRRLYVYQQAGIEIPYVKLDKISGKELKKFSTTNNGASIEVRKPITKQNP